MTRSIVAAALALLLAAPVAAATTPGRNGSIVLGGNTDYKYPSANTSFVMEVDPKTGRVSQHDLCHPGLVLERDCRWLSGMAVSPSGEQVAAYTMVQDSISGEVVRRGMLRLIDRRDWSVRVVALSCSWCVGPWSTDLSWYPNGSALVASPQPLRSGTLAPSVLGIFGLALDGADQGRIASAGTSAPAWSAQGRLAFIRDGNLYTARPGEAERRLTWRGAATPVWSPHGTWIAFTRCGPERGCDVHVVARDGGGARRLVRDGYDPAWSPDGRYIAFLRATPPNAVEPGPSLFRLDRRTGRVRRMTRELVTGYETVGRPQWTTPLPR